MGTPVVAIKEIHRVVKPGVAAKEKGQRGTPPQVKKIAVGTQFVVDDEKELDFLRRSKSVKDPETPSQIAEAKVNLNAFDSKKANFAAGQGAEGSDAGDGDGEPEGNAGRKSKQRGEVTTETDAPNPKGKAGGGRKVSAKGGKAASDLI